MNTKFEYVTLTMQYGSPLEGAPLKLFNKTVSQLPSDFNWTLLFGEDGQLNNKMMFKQMSIVDLEEELNVLKYKFNFLNFSFNVVVRVNEKDHVVGLGNVKGTDSELDINKEKYNEIIRSI